MKRNFKIVIEYDGTLFHGWQRQPDKQTIQGELEHALQVMTTRHVDVHGSGRTDAGVHAFAQTASFSCDTKITETGFKKGLNCLIPESILIKSCEEISPDFHARFSAVKKTYEYKILNRPLRPAIGKGYVWYISKILNIESMKLAASFLEGEHDFKSFEAAGSPRAHTTRIVSGCNVKKEGDIVSIEITANGFLRYMVRNITGTLVQTGLDKLNPDKITEIIEQKKRSAAGMTAPPNGLFLKEVIYKD